jgi:ASCH domain.
MTAMRVGERFSAGHLLHLFTHCLKIEKTMEPDRTTHVGTEQVRLALSIRQPHVEAILRGIKTFEYRNFPTRIRERIYIYAGRMRYAPAEERRWMAEYGFDLDPSFRMDLLDSGLLVATVRITTCVPGGRYGAAWAWKLEDLEKLDSPQRPTGRPQPVFFNPFPTDS